MPLAEKLTTTGLGRGYRGTAKTIKAMHKLAAKGKLDPSLHEIATLIRLSVPDDQRGSTKATADAIYYWVKRHGIFQRDPFQIERIDHPISSMKSIIEARKSGAYSGPGLFVGDCDTYSIWVAALGGLLGFNYAFETAKVDPVRPDEFSHVWTALRVNGDWVAYDASTPRSYPGWRPPVSGPDQFKSWPEKAIEDTMGMGEDFLPMDDYGYGVPKDRDWTKAVADDVDPGRMDLLVPPDTGTPMAEMEPGNDFFVKEPIPLAGDRPSLMEGDETFNTGPRYSKGPEYYNEVRGPYPIESRWNRIRVDDSDRSRIPRGTQVHVSPSTVPVRDVDIVSGVSAPIMREGKMKVLRRPDGNAVIMRPRRVAAGMGADEPSGIVTSISEPAAGATSSVWSDISKVISSVLPDATKLATTAVEAKYQTALASATSKLLGQQVTPQQVIQTVPMPSSKPWYTQTWVWVGGGLAALGIGYVVVSNMGGGRRRRR